MFFFHFLLIADRLKAIAASYVCFDWIEVRCNGEMKNAQNKNESYNIAAELIGNSFTWSHGFLIHSHIIRID